MDATKYGFFCCDIVKDTSGNPILDSSGNEQSILGLRYEELYSLILYSQNNWIQKQQNQIDGLTAFIQSKFPDYMSGNI